MSQNQVASTEETTETVDGNRLQLKLLAHEKKIAGVVSCLLAAGVVITPDLEKQLMGLAKSAESIHADFASKADVLGVAYQASGTHKDAPSAMVRALLGM